MASRYAGEMYDASESEVLAVSERTELGERIAALEALVGQAMELEKFRDEVLRREMNAAVAEIRNQISAALKDILIRFENVNEWRQTYGDLVREKVSQKAFESEVKALDDKIGVNTAARLTSEAQLQERDKEEKRRADERERIEKRISLEREIQQRKMMWQVGLVVTIVSMLIGLILRFLKV